MAEHLVPLVLLLVASGVTSFVSTGIVKAIAVRVGAIDRPDERKKHAGETPRLGGLAIIFGFGFPLMLMAANPRAASLVSKNLTYLFAVLASGSLVVGLGVYDDILGSDALKKFAVQTAAAVILVSFGFKFDFITVAGGVLSLGVLGFLASVIWIVGVINAVNFIDGMDSLATVVSITIAIAFAVIAVLRYDVFSLVIMTALAGSLLGFYPWNKPPAKIFMGDTGSLFIGLLLAACSIARPSKSPVAVIIGGPILALALPVLDTLIVMQKRFGGRRAPAPITRRITRMFNADRNHIHHILVAKYGSVAKAIASIWLITLLFATAAVMTVADTTKLYGYSAAVLALLVMLFLRYGFRRNGTPPALPEATRDGAGR